MFAPFLCGKCSSNLFLGTWDYTQGKWFPPWAVSPALWVSFILRLLYSFCIRGLVLSTGRLCFSLRRFLLQEDSGDSALLAWGSPPILPFLLLLLCSAGREPCSLLSPLISCFFFSWLPASWLAQSDGALSLHWMGMEETRESRDRKGQEGWAHTY